MCRISLIIPVYNVEPFLRWCLDSVKKQSFLDFEAILVDDGSKDNGGKICDEYAAADSRFKVIHQKNQGLSAARNNGTALAEGEYIGYLDSDDIIHPDYLKNLYEAASESGARISVTKFISINESEDTFPENKDNENFSVISGRDAAKIIVAEHKRFMITATGKLYHKSLINKLIYPAGKINEDEFVTYKVLYETEKAALCDSALYGYRRRRNSIMRKPSPRLDALDALYGAIAYFEEKSDEEMAAAARRRYLLNIELAWYRTYRGTENNTELLQNLKEKHKLFYRENKNRIGRLTFMESSELIIFNLSPTLYAWICTFISIISVS